MKRPNKTAGVFVLVQEVLGTLPQPYGEDVILDLFLAIEGSPRLRRIYDGLVAQLTKDVANNWIGKYTKRLANMRTLKPGILVQPGHVITAYTKLGR